MMMAPVEERHWKVVKDAGSDANLLKNRVSKLKQIENKMLKKIDKTRIEAEKVRQQKDSNNERI